MSTDGFGSRKCCTILLQWLWNAFRIVDCLDQFKKKQKWFSRGRYMFRCFITFHLMVVLMVIVWCGFKTISHSCNQMVWFGDCPNIMSVRNPHLKQDGVGLWILLPGEEYSLLVHRRSKQAKSFLQVSHTFSHVQQHKVANGASCYRHLQPKLAKSLLLLLWHNMSISACIHWFSVFCTHHFEKNGFFPLFEI